jgi:hypothetical protein
MAIRARCTDCDKGYTVDDKNAGKTLKCKACGGAVKVPAAEGVARVAGGASARASASSAPRAAAVSKPRPAPVAEASGDGFADMDALLALESGGTVMEEPPALAPPPLPSKPARVAAAGAMPRVPGSTVPRRQPGWQKNNDMGNGITAAALGKILMIGGGVIGLIFVLGLAVNAFKLVAVLLLITIGGLLLLSMWVGCLMCAAREGCLFLYVILPYYPIYFVLSRIEETKLYLLAGIGGIVCMIGAATIIMTDKRVSRAELVEPMGRARVALVRAA